MFKRTDSQLIDKALKGHQRAWQQLIERHQNSLYYFLLRLTGNPDDAYDVMQDTLLSVCRSLGDFRGDSEFKTWLLKIGHFRCVEFFRRKRWFVDEDVVAHADAQQQSDGPEHQLQGEQQQRLCLAAMAQLPFEHRIIVELKLFQQQTFDVIADQLGVSVNTVKSRFYGSLDKIKPILEAHHDAA